MSRRAIRLQSARSAGKDVDKAPAPRTQGPFAVKSKVGTAKGTHSFHPR